MRAEPPDYELVRSWSIEPIRAKDKPPRPPEPKPLPSGFAIVDVTDFNRCRTVSCPVGSQPLREGVRTYIVTSY